MQKISSSSQLSKRRVAIAKAHETHWSPNIDVYVTEGSLIIKIELAGMQRQDLELTIEGRKLRISGQRPDGCRPPECKFLVMEINYGTFESVIEVPEECDLSVGKAVYQNGFLRIEAPFAPASTSGPRSISITED
jgi:HSP20 family protein